MKFPARQSGSDFKICPAGVHVGICNMVADLGFQEQRGRYGGTKREVYIRFEIPELPISYTKDGKEISGPMSLGRRFTASMSEKANLRAFVEGLFSKKCPSQRAADDFDVSSILGRQCLLTIVHEEGREKPYAKIMSASPLPQAMATMYRQHNASINFSLDEPDDAQFNALPEWLRETINTRIEAPTQYNKPHEREAVQAQQVARERFTAQLAKGEKEQKEAAADDPDDDLSSIPFDLVAA